MDYNPNSTPLSLQEQRALEMYFNKETESMATHGYYSHSENAILRRDAVRLIVQHSKCAKFDAFIPYLAMTYFDRYISRHQLPKVATSEPDDVLLLAICCLSLAWKMRKKSFSITKFLEARELNIDRLKILKVELMILNGLNWRMRAVTAICFVGLFFNLIRARQGFIRRSINEIIIQAQGDITYTQFRPSVIAASAVLAASSFLYPNEFEFYKQRISNYEHVKEEDVTACLDLMTAMCKKKEIVMKTAELESRQAREPSGSTQPSQSAPSEPPMDEPSGSFQPSQPALAEPPMDEPSGSFQPSQPAPTEPPMDKPSVSSQPSQPAPTEPPMDEPSIPPMKESPEIQEVPESEQGPQMNFEIKWVTNENEDLTIHCPVVSAEARDVDTETDVPTIGCSNYPRCCSVQ